MANLAKDNQSRKFKVGVGIGTSSVKTSSRTFHFLNAGKDFSQWSHSATTDKYFRTFFLIWIIPLFFTVCYILVNYSNLPNEIPLFYSRLWGATQLANSILIFLPLGGTLLLGIFNLSLATSYHEKDKVLSYFLAGSASLVSLLSAITVINIVNLMK